MKIEERQISYGVQGETIQFLHANAYPPGCYSKFFRAMEPSYQVLAPLQRPLWDRTSAHQLRSWNVFRDDLIQFMDSHQLKNMIGIGHSLGGIASWLASIERPDLFKALILIDPVIIAHGFVRGTKIFPFSLKKKFLPIIKIASRRRHQWPDRESVRLHLGSKKLFKRFDPEVFEDFLKYGIIDTDEGVELAFPREWEARIYSCPPDMWKVMPVSTCPVTIIKAEFSDVITQESWSQIQQLTPNGQFYEMKGVGHLVPFERPLELADLVQQIIGQYL